MLAHPAGPPLLGAVLSRLGRRGLAVQAALALRLAARELPPGQRSAALVAVLTHMTDPRGIEKVLEALLVTTDRPLPDFRSLHPLARLHASAQALLGGSPSSTDSPHRLPGFDDSELQEALVTFVLTRPSDFEPFCGPELLKRRPMPLASIALLVEVLGDERVRGPSALLLVTAALLPLWAPEAAVAATPIPQQSFATAVLLAALHLLFEQHGHQGIGAQIPEILRGVGSRLGSPLQGVRLQGMRVGNLLSRMIRVEGAGEDAGAVTDLFADENPWSMAAEELWPLVLGPTYGLVEFLRTLQQGCVALPPALQPPDTKTSAEAQGVSDSEELGPAAMYAKKMIEQATAPDSDDDDGGASVVSSFEDADVVPLEALDLSEGEDEVWRPDPETGARPPQQLKALAADLRNPKDVQQVLRALQVTEQLVRAAPSELAVCAEELARSLLYCRVPDWAEDTGPAGNTAVDQRMRSIAAVLVQQPMTAGPGVIHDLFAPSLDMGQRLLVLDCLCLSAREMAEGGPTSSAAVLPPGRSDPPVPQLPSASTNRGPKTRIFGPVRLQQLRSGGMKEVTRRNAFGAVAVEWAGAILSGMHGSGRSHGIDLFGRDFVLLGRLLTTLGTFAECSGFSAATPRVAAAVLELLQAPVVSEHAQPYVRRAALLAGVQILSALPPASIAAEHSGGAPSTGSLTQRIHWLRDWATLRLESDADEQVRALAAGCLELQRALASRALGVLAAAPKTAEQLAEELRPTKIALPWRASS